MGCPLSKDETKSNANNNNKTEITGDPAMSRYDQIDYKARLERKMCLAKETPEPDFDLSECNLKDVPAGVFVLCRVLRKEVLNLRANRITDFVSGPLSDLSLLHVLNLAENKLRRLPDDLYRLENLRELILSDNLLTQLPASINTLHRLELLDISNNQIESIEPISCMPALRILNITGNLRLRTLPTTLATCDALHDLIYDEQSIDWPPAEVLAGGTENILKFLMTGESRIVAMDGVEEVAREANENVPVSREDALIKKLEERDRRSHHHENKPKIIPTDDGYGNENALIEQLQLRQQKQKQELLQAVLLQQNETEDLVNRVQQQKDQERDMLIKDIRKDEENANLVIEQLLALRSGPDPALLEKERMEEERLLEKLHLEHSELRKHEILATMLQVLHNEDNKLLDYQHRRNETSRDILERELESSKQLKDFFVNYEKSRNDIIEKICYDEELQKQAVAKLIQMNDARTWGLVEQLKIVEAQLANMTQFEMDKKTFSSMEQMNELAEKRMRLTFVLTDLLEQQEARKKELLDTLLTMESQKHNEEDFWLLQYQRLIDSRPLEFSIKSQSIDPLLGYNFLVNGVIHCLPFLQKLWQSSSVNIEKIQDEDLRSCGIKSEKDRKLILKSIDDFVRENHGVQLGRVILEEPSAPADMNRPSTSREVRQRLSDEEEEEKNGRLSAGRSDAESLAECVVCMERTVKIIFIPCGHMCCCSECQNNLTLCPMCRSAIERKIKVLQP